MVQSPDFNNRINQPVYSAVKINITHPMVNAPSDNENKATEGQFNAVDLNIDSPEVNTKPIYTYPEAQGPITYDMANIRQIPLPAGFPTIAYQTTNVILPKNTVEAEIELEVENDDEDEEEVGTAEENEAPDDKAPVLKEETTKPEPPAPAYTTVEAEKAPEVKAEEIPIEEDVDAIPDDVKIMEEETKQVELKRPEIIPGEEIKPEVDIPLVIENLTNQDFDIQAQQMEEIARISLDNPENAVPYIVRDVFATLIDITKKDTTQLAAPTNEQVNARRKLMANYVALENSATNPQAQIQLPFRLTEQEVALANEISPMEQAERNKEYALYTIAILAKVYTDEVEKQTGNIVPMTDIPGTSAMVDALRYSPNAGVKIAAIDALRHIQRPEYKEEMTTLFTLAQADSNPEVAYTANRALERINRNN